jgi:DNA-binding NarL/FixJ family response regulator
MEVVGEAEDGLTAIRLARKLKPDVIIMDVNMPGTDGIDATRRIINETGNVKVIALSMFPKRSFVEEMLKAGASGYMLKDQAFDELVRAIKTVMAGKTYLCPKVTGMLVGNYVLEQSPTKNIAAVLTNRQREILKLLAEGKTSKEVAANLKISAKTVDACRRRIMNKVQVRSIAELVKYAIREGVTTLDK